MTREEAARILYNQWQGFLEDKIDYAGVSDAYKMAIKALEQEPCKVVETVKRVDIEITKADYELIIRSLTCELGKVADALLYAANPLDEQKATKKYEQISNLFQQFYANSTKSTIVIQIKE